MSSRWFSLLACWFAIVLWLPACPAEEPASAEQLLARLQKQHPRLLIDAAGFSDLKRRMAADPYLQQCDKAVRAEAEQLLTAKLPEHVIPDGLRLLATSRRVLHRSYTLAMAYRLHGDRRYADRLWQEVQTVAAFPDFNPRHFLDTAEMTHALAIAYDWLYDTWSPEQRATLRRAIVEMGLKPGLPVYEKNRWWAACDHNWNQVCNGGLTMGALAVGDEEPALAGNILRYAIASLPRAMQSYGPDGGWPEGPGYWAYATSYNVVMLAGLQSALGTDFGLSKTPGFDQTALFTMYLTGPTDRSFNFSDSSEHASRPECLFWLAGRFQQPVAAWFAMQGSPSAPAMLWYRTAGKTPTAAQLPLDRYWRRVEVVTLRGAWDDPRTTFVAVQAGSNRRNHAHLDQGSFVLDALGRRWAFDLGGDDYNLPGYFGKQRYDYYRLRAEGHNTLVIAPDKGPDQSVKADCSIRKFTTTPARAATVADLTPAYAKVSSSVRRGIAILDRRSVLVQDEIVAPTGDIWWFVHTRGEIRLSSDAREAEVMQGDARLKVHLLSPAGARLEVAPATPLPTSPQPQRQADNEKIRKLVVHLTQAQAAPIAVWFVPQDGRAPTAQPRVTPLDKW